ncbi:hypothetical protein OAR43_09970 [Gammaproteobacteria bacterium]|nr:hypothetical protein [Gammaproteobacteria bacterium]
MRQVKRLRLKQKKLSLIAMVIVAQSLSGLFATSHAGVSRIHWITVCTQQGAHQISVILPGVSDQPWAPELLNWGCPDCVQMPAISISISIARDRVVAGAVLLQALDRYRSTVAGLVSVTGAEFPPRAPPSALIFS